MRTSFDAKVFSNKRTNQYSITIPKKELNIPKDKIPKEIKIKIKGVKWYE